MDDPKPLLYLCGAEPRRSFVPPSVGTYVRKLDEYGGTKEVASPPASPAHTAAQVGASDGAKRRVRAKVDAEAIRKACLSLVADGLPIEGIGKRFRVSQWRIRKWVMREKRDAARRSI